MRAYEKIAKLLNENDDLYIRGVNNLEDIKKYSIDIFEGQLLELSGGVEEIENNLNVPYSIEENTDSRIIIEYAGSNVSSEWDSMLTDQYHYIAVVKGDIQGDNYHNDGLIMNIDKIVAVFDKNGNEIEYE